MGETSQNIKDTLGGTQMTLLRWIILRLEQHCMHLLLVSCFKAFLILRCFSDYKSRHTSALWEYFYSSAVFC